MTTTTNKYNVGGVMLDRPFKIRRLGHFGFNGTNMDACWKFYVDLLGFKVSQPTAGGGFFGRHNGDHHSMVIFDRKLVEERLKASGSSAHIRAENDINQITWQVQSLNEVWQGTKYFKDLEMEVRTEGRAPTGVGSNYHLYVWDPDDQINEFFYGMEQIGWDGKTKPTEMGRREPVATMEPHISEYAEINDDITKGIQPNSGYRFTEEMPEIYNVDDFLLARPFKIVRVGPVNLFVDSMEPQRRVLPRCHRPQPHGGSRVAGRQGDLPALRHGAPLDRPFPEELAIASSASATRRPTCRLACSSPTTVSSRTPSSFLRDNGVRVETDIIPPELYPGIDYAAFAFDPDDHCIMLYSSMEQLGWSGQPRPAAPASQGRPQQLA